jgi:DNA-binding NarL/FixJ family response regulator
MHIRIDMPLSLQERNRQAPDNRISKTFGLKKGLEVGRLSLRRRGVWAHSPAADASPLGSLDLTPRETEVLTWIAQGKTNYEIGVILSACTRTICKHVEHILSKLCVENRTAAAAIALATLAQAKG